MSSFVNTQASNAASDAGVSQSDYERLRSYIASCPVLPENHPAVQAALTGLEQAYQKSVRDEKLRQQFANKNNNISAPKAANKVSGSNKTEPTKQTPVAVAQRSTMNTNDNNSDDDWEDATATDVVVMSAMDDTDVEILENERAEELRQQVLTALQQHQVQVSSPLAALTVALHAVLLQHAHRCTGVPVAPAQNSLFAPPVRELSASQFLPEKWESPCGPAACLALRYKSPNGGAMILRVELNSFSGLVQVSWQKEEGSDAVTMSFPLEQHFNLESWQAAAAGTILVPPALHYKQLSQLLIQFVQTLKLEAPSVEQQQPVSPSQLYVDRSVQSFPSSRPAATPLQTTPALVPTTVNEAFFDRTRFSNGDFAGDLMPGGMVGIPGMGGNLMVRKS
jgi:hypothetical protein